MIFLIDESKKGAKSLAKKMSKEGQPGAIIMLTPDEMECSKGMHVVPLTKEGSNHAELVEIKPNVEYIMVCDSTVNIDDALDVAYASSAAIHIVRAGEGNQ